MELRLARLFPASVCASWRKLRTVATVATRQTDQLWAKRVETLSKQSLEELAKCERGKQSIIAEIKYQENEDSSDKFCPGTELNIAGKSGNSIGQLTPRVNACWSC